MHILKKLLSNPFIILFSLLFLILFKPVLFERKVLVPGDIPYTTPLWENSITDSSFYKANNYLLSDQINQFYIWREFVRNSILKSEGIPLWNPYVFAGQPLVANSQSAVFYPPNLFIYFFSPGTVININAFFNIFIFSLFGFFYSREIGISSAGSWFVSLSLALSGPVILWMGHPHSNVFVWLPMLLWGIEKIIKGDNRLIYIATTATAFGSALLGGHPETAFHLCLVCGLYLFLRIFRIKKGIKSVKYTIFGLIISILAGIFLGSVQILPFADFMFNSGTLKNGGRGVGNNMKIFSDEFIPNLSSSITLFYPDFFGNPVDRSYNWPYKKANNYIEQSVYTGFIPFFLFFVAMLSKKKSGILRILIILSFFSLLLAWRFPLIEMVNHLPVFSIVSNGRLKIFFTIFVIIASGYGFDILRRELAGKNSNAIKKRLKIYLIIPAVSIILFILFLIVSLMLRSGYEQLFLNSFSLKNLKIAVSIMAALIIFLVLIFKIKKKLFFSKWVITNILIATTIIELFFLASGFNTTIREDLILPDTAVLKKMRRDEPFFRITADSDIFLPNYNISFGLQMLGGYDLPVDEKYSKIFSLQGGKNIHNHSWERYWPLADLLNAGFYIKKGDYENVGKRYELYYSSENFTVYKNLKPFPRAFLATNYEVIPDENELIKRLISGEFDLKKRVLLGKDPKFLLPASEPGNSLDNNKVIIEKYGNEIVEFKTDSEKESILVLCDVFTKDWKAEIDGKGTEIFRVDLILRGVMVPSGSHSIRFIYKPYSFEIGKKFSYLGILFILSSFFSGIFLRIKS